MKENCFCCSCLLLHFRENSAEKHRLGEYHRYQRQREWQTSEMLPLPLQFKQRRWRGNHSWSGRWQRERTIGHFLLLHLKWGYFEWGGGRTGAFCCPQAPHELKCSKIKPISWKQFHAAKLRYDCVAMGKMMRKERLILTAITLLIIDPFTLCHSIFSREEILGREESSLSHTDTFWPNVEIALKVYFHTAHKSAKMPSVSRLVIQSTNAAQCDS